AMRWNNILGAVPPEVWVALPGCNPSPMCPPGTPPGRIGVFNTIAMAFTADIHLPARFSQALFLAFDKYGNLWFPMPMSNEIGMYNLSTAKFHKWTVPTASSGPWDIAIDAQGYIWFTEHYTNQI